MAVGGLNLVFELEKVLLREHRNTQEKACDVLEYFRFYGYAFENYIHVMAENIEQNIYYSYWHYFIELLQSDDVKYIVQHIYNMWFASRDDRVEFSQCLWAFIDMQKQYLEYQQHCNCDYCSLPDLI